jgi:DNA-binding PadR family transcriptional regulator
LSRNALKPQWFHILLALAGEDRHGYGIMTEVLSRTGGTMKLWPGVLYGSLRRMVDAGLIREVVNPSEAPPDDNKERRYYRITARGRRALTEEAERMAQYVAIARERSVIT